MELVVLIIQRTSPKAPVSWAWFPSHSYEVNRTRLFFFFFCTEIRCFNFQLKERTQSQEKWSSPALWAWLRVWWGIIYCSSTCARAARWASLDVTLMLNLALWSRTFVSFHLKLCIFHSSPHLPYFPACNAQGISWFTGASFAVHKYFSCLKAGSELGQIEISKTCHATHFCAGYSLGKEERTKKA